VDFPINASLESCRLQQVLLDRKRRREAVRLAELRERFATLTELERQIMTLVVIGRANKQVAAELSLSEMTVKVHRGQVMRKMHARSLPELVRMADRLGEPTQRRKRSIPKS
jgi:FixJ family two-component response regulator